MTMLALGLLAAASLSGLKPGAIIKLPPGPHPMVEIRDESYDPPITIDARGAIVAGVRLWHASGVIWKGGIIEAPKGQHGAGPNGWGVDGRWAKNISFDNIESRNAHIGMIFSNSEGLVVRGGWFHALQSDGINIVGVTNVLVEDSRFEDFRPVRATGIRGTPSFRDGDHPDAVQIWTSKDRPFGRDIVIRRNKVHGMTQGINMFGPIGDGYERVSITDNVVDIFDPPAISMFSCTDCEITGNRVSALPGAPYNVNIRTDNSKGRFCNNRVDKLPNHPTARRC